MPSDLQGEVLDRLSSFDTEKSAIIIRVRQQTLSLFQAGSFTNSYPISSSRSGTGCQQDSFCTPVGIHRVAEKIGGGCRCGEIIQGRVPTGEIADIISDKKSGDADLITTRLLWLQGQEPGLNSGDGVDSYDRYIYIHGTNEEGLIGQPASQGCIRMKNTDIIELFEMVEVGTVVLIVDD